MYPGAADEGRSAKPLFPIEEQQRAQRLVLGRGRDLLADGERREKGTDFRGAHLRRMPLPVEKDVALDPMDVRLLGAAAVVAGAAGLPRPVARAGGVRASPSGPP